MLAKVMYNVSHLLYRKLHNQQKIVHYSEIQLDRRSVSNSNSSQEIHQGHLTLSPHQIKISVKKTSQNPLQSFTQTYIKMRFSFFTQIIKSKKTKMFTQMFEVYFVTFKFTTLPLMNLLLRLDRQCGLSSGKENKLFG